MARLTASTGPRVAGAVTVEVILTYWAVAELFVQLSTPLESLTQEAFDSTVYGTPRTTTVRASE